MKQRSPFAGLAAAVKRGDVKLPPPPTAEERELFDVARLIFGLAELAGVRVYPHHREVDYSWIDFGDREPPESFAVARNGRVIRHTCEYSGHNGDSYGDEYFFLAGGEAKPVLDRLVTRLEGMALGAEERRLEEAAVRRRTEAAKANLRARLKGKGVI